MTTKILVFLSWNEEGPGWVARAESVPAAHGEAPVNAWTSDISSICHGIPIIETLAFVSNLIAKGLNIHPDNTQLEIHVSGSEIFEAARRIAR